MKMKKYYYKYEKYKYEKYISPGSVGGKIKKIRELRGYTQKQLGISCGFFSVFAAFRIAKYEKSKKTPRKRVLKKIAEALGINENALFNLNLLSHDYTCHALFDIEDFHGLYPVKKEDGYYLKFGGPSLHNQIISGYPYELFLKDWYEMYQEHLPISTDTKAEKERKITEYTLQRYEYPLNIVKGKTDSGNECKTENVLEKIKDELGELAKQTDCPVYYGDKEIDSYVKVSDVIKVMEKIKKTVD